MLFTTAELLDLRNNRRYQDLRRQFLMPPQRLDQALFSEVFFGVAERFGYPVCVEYESVS